VAGDVYAVLGGICSALYIIVGRRLRPTVSWPRYVGTVYPLTALLLLAVTLVAREPLAGHSNYTWGMLALLAIGPQLVGHNAINWSLAYVPAVLVAMAILGEPIGATVWAALVLDELPSASELAGAPLVLLGVYLALRPARVEVVSGSRPSADLGDG
jgi:drug/metabolite transporter (DMT)-like permease